MEYGLPLIGDKFPRLEVVTPSCELLCILYLAENVRAKVP
jgi:hypothetical protein